LRPRATVSLTAEGKPPTVCCHGILHRDNCDFAAPPPGYPERHPDSRCTPQPRRAASCFGRHSNTPEGAESVTTYEPQTREPAAASSASCYGFAAVTSATHRYRCAALPVSPRRERRGFFGCLPCREAEQTALPPPKRREHLGGAHILLRGHLRRSRPLARSPDTRMAHEEPFDPTDRPVTRTDPQLPTARPCDSPRREAPLSSGYSRQLSTGRLERVLRSFP
jgi:hypothetical protein